MFKISDKTRRGVTLLIFLLLGPLLLIAVLGGIVSRHSVRTVEEWQLHLSQMIGTPVEIESVEFPAPGVVRFGKFRMIEAETGTTLLSIPEWELIEIAGDAPMLINPATLFENGNGTVNIKQASAEMHQDPEFYESYLDRKPYKRKLFGSFNYICSKLVGRRSYWQCEIPSAVCYDAVISKGKKEMPAWLAKLPLPSEKSDVDQIHLPVVLHIGKLDFLLTKQSDNSPNTTVAADAQQKENGITKASKQLLTFNNVVIESRVSRKETKWLSTFRRHGPLGVPGDQSIETKSANATALFSLQLSAAREKPHHIDVRFSTGEMSVPISLISPCHSFFDGFGEQCTFQGDITMTNEKEAESLFGDRTTVQFRNAAFSQVSLKPLWGSLLAFEIDGNLERLDLNDAVFSIEHEKGSTLQLKQASGRVINGTGRVYWPGFSRLVQATHLTMTPADAAPPQDDVLFRNGNFSFAINENGIRLAPKILPAQNQQLPLLEIDNHCCIWWPTGTHCIQYIEMLAALASPISPQIPLTQQTQHLLQLLPIEIGLSAQGIAAMRPVPIIEERVATSPTTSMTMPQMTALGTQPLPSQWGGANQQQSVSNQGASTQGMSSHPSITAMREQTQNTVPPNYSSMYQPQSMAAQTVPINAPVIQNQSSTRHIPQATPNNHTNNDLLHSVPSSTFPSNTTITQSPHLNTVSPANQEGRTTPLFLNPAPSLSHVPSPSLNAPGSTAAPMSQPAVTNNRPMILQAWQQ